MWAKLQYLTFASTSRIFSWHIGLHLFLVAHLVLLSLLLPLLHVLLAKRLVLCRQLAGLCAIWKGSVKLVSHQFEGSHEKISKKMPRSLHVFEESTARIARDHKVQSSCKKLCVAALVGSP